MITTICRSTALAAAMFLPQIGVAQDLITRDRVGPADAPNVMTFRLGGVAKLVEI